jgi:hypothetical protein
VDAVEITAENIEEVAPFIGDLRTQGDGTPYILVDPRLVPSVPKVYIGFFMTKIGDNVHCYSRRIFRDQYLKHTPEIQGWLDYLTGDNADATPAEAG